MPPLLGDSAASAPTRFAGEADAEATELLGGGDESFGYLVRKNTLPKARPAEFEFLKKLSGTSRKCLTDFAGRNERARPLHGGTSSRALPFALK